MDQAKKTNKQKYRVLCSNEASIPIFSKDWWLDAVAGDNWDVVFVEKNGQIQASLPFIIKKRLGMTILSMPQLTQTLGPWLKPSNAKYAKRLAQEKDLIQALFDQLPDHAEYRQNWHYTCTNWLPLYWKGYTQMTRYTYRLNCLSDIEKLWDGLQENIRRDIKKAQNREKILVRTDLGIDDFLSLNKKTFLRQGKELPYSEELVRRIYDTTSKKCMSRLFIAQDPQGRHHAGIFIVWDRESSYYLLGGGDPELRRSGATSLCMWEAIKFSASVTKSFDFEGSMIEPIERFFRGFGAVQTPYFSISKVNSKLLKFYRLLQGFKN